MTGQPNRVACVMPTFNRWELVAERIAELEAAQAAAGSALKLEPTVVDDHSERSCPPRLLVRIHELGGQYVRLFKNSGSVSIPRNVGIAASSGDFIAHTDDDVAILPGKFPTLLAAFTRQTDLAYAGVMIEHADGRSGYAFRPDWNPCTPDGYGVDGSQFIYRRNVFRRIPLHFATRGCDWELAKRIHAPGNFAAVNQAVAIYRWHGGNRSLDPATKTRPIHPGHFSAYFRFWSGAIDYQPIAAR